MYKYAFVCQCVITVDYIMRYFSLVCPLLEKKMAETDSTITVLVVEGDYSALHKLGFPLPALAAMQAASVQLRQVCWDVKQSSTGISVSLFWPKASQTLFSSTLKISKSKKHRIRRKRNKCATADVKELMPQPAKPVKPAEPPPINAHPAPECQVSDCDDRIFLMLILLLRIRLTLLSLMMMCSIINDAIPQESV